jgi:hypothetical protein
MPNPKPDAEAALHKLGQRVHEGIANTYPASGKSLETVRNAVREQYEQEQKAERERKPSPDATKNPDRKRDEPEPER